ncbi:glycoprotein A33 (transmembrane), paralog a [Alosa sapidissima]|uniref:glycoprotein A33 (transmembrane), paralog a n=1 Tax=Alosa sapidissima TaxID=34773 RepID=UPI001C07F9CA|nr:glycoprotein A33 (transmembrane), paralog a [Alosa sapidissima]
MTKMGDALLTFYVFLIGFSLVMAITVNIPQDNYEFARGDNITLPCSFTTKVASPQAIVTWTVEGDEGEERTILTYYSFSQTLDITEVYEGRVDLLHNIAAGKADLKLNNIALADNKKFECKIQVPKDDEGKPADTARLVVLVAPSPPICAVEGKQEYGRDIKLTCRSEEGSPPPIYKWQSHDVRNTPRPLLPRATDQGGVLSLFNISMETSGYYICTSSNKIRSATCNMTLSVMPMTMNMGMTAGIIGGVVAAILSLILIIYCCCCRKKKVVEEYAMGEPEGGKYHDGEPAEESPINAERGNRERALDGDRPYERSESDYDGQSDYNHRSDRSHRDDHRDERYDDRYDDRRDRHNDRYDDHYDDRRDSDQYDDDRSSSRNRYNDRGGPPSVPINKPSRN